MRDGIPIGFCESRDGAVIVKRSAGGALLGWLLGVLGCDGGVIVR